MNAPEFLITLTLLRLVIPFGLVLLIGEWTNRRERSERMRSEPR